MSIFKDYPNKYFVETGTCSGGGVLRALQCGYNEIRSIEISEKLHEYCKVLFKDEPRVKLYRGDSTEMLWDMIKDLGDPITFFLDGHPSGGLTSSNERNEIELLKELAQIGRHPIKTHTILIDDYRDYYTCHLEEIISKINPEYKFSFGTYQEGYPNDLLIAVV